MPPAPMRIINSAVKSVPNRFRSRTRKALSPQVWKTPKTRRKTRASTRASEKASTRPRVTSKDSLKGLDHSERGEPPAILTVPLFFFTREDAAEGQVRPRVKRPLNLLKGFLFEASHFWSQWLEKKPFQQIQWALHSWS